LKDIPSDIPPNPLLTLRYFLITLNFSNSTYFIKMEIFGDIRFVESKNGNR